MSRTATLDRERAATFRKERRERNRKKPDVLGAIRTVLVLLLIAQVLRIAFTSPLMRLQEVRISGTERYSPEDVVRLAGVPLGRNIFSVNLVHVSERLRRQPAVREAVVTREFPRALHVELSERQPTFQVVSRGRTYSADQGGVVFEIVPTAKPDLPVLEIPGEELPRLGGSVRPELVRVVEECRALAQREQLTLGKMRVDAAGELWLNIRTSPESGAAPKPLKVRVGRATELPEKFRDIRLALAGRPDLASSAVYLDVMCAGRTAYPPLTDEVETQ